MLLKIKADLLASILARLSSIPANKARHAALECFKLRVAGSTLTVTATNLDIWGEVYTHDIEGQDGEIVVNAQLLSSLVKAQAGADLELVTSNGKAVLKGRAQATLPTLIAEDFPHLPQPTDIAGSINPAALVAAIAEAGYAAATDGARPNLCGVYVGKARVVSTDGHRCVALDVPGALPVPGMDGVLIPGPLADIIERAFAKRPNADVAVSSQYLVISTIDMTFGGRLVDMGYPDVSAVIPKEQPSFSVSKEQLTEAVKLASLVKPAVDKIELRFWSIPGSLGVLAESSQHGEVRQSVDLTGMTESPRATKVSVNWRYLAEALANIAEPTVEIVVTTDLAPMALSGRPGSIHLVMPMRG